MVLEATYGWDRAAAGDGAPGRQGSRASVHLAHPLWVKAPSYRRDRTTSATRPTWRTCSGRGRLPEAWIAPPATRELRELVRHRATLVALRSHSKAQIHAVLATCGIQVSLSDLFGVDGTALLDRLDLPVAHAARVASHRRLIEAGQFEIDLLDGMARGRLAHDPGYAAVQTIPGIGPVLGAVLGALIGDITRFARPEQQAAA